MAIIGISAKGAATILTTVNTDKGAHCAAADDRDNAYVCDPKGGRLLIVKDTLAPSGSSAQSPYNSYRVGKRMIHRRDSSPAENVTRHPGDVTITKFWIPDSATADSKRLVGTRALRGFADGAVSILLPSYLTALGLSGIQIGIVLFSTLFGSALVSLWAGFAAHSIGRRRLLLGACALMLATGLGFTYVRNFWPLVVVAFVGTLNPSAGDVSLFLPLEQTALAETVATTDLTRLFALYNVAGALAGASALCLVGCQPLSLRDSAGT